MPSPYSLLSYEVPERFNQATFLVDRHLTEGRGGNVALIADPSGGIFAIQKWQMDESERGAGAQ